MKTTNEAVRLDKWLWAARFYKTRSIARNMVDGGKVHYNGQRSKPSKIVELGAVITLRQGNEEKTVTIEKISAHRGGAPVAQTLYEETTESLAKREELHNSASSMLIAQHQNVAQTKSNVVTSSSSRLNKLEGIAKWQTQCLQVMF